jgi:hypothetical protein
MSTKKSRHRPDSVYWEASQEERKKINIDKLDAELEVYSTLYFKLGQRFKLSKDYQAVPKGTYCTVIKEWPDTCIRWDKWSKQGRGAQRRSRCMSYELDLNLEEE